MGITNLYSNLPGHLVEFQDGGMQLRSTSESSTTKSILIIGTAFDGPVNEPVAIDMSTVANLYGSEVDANGIPNGATLTKYAKQAYKCGFNDIRCMRATGSVAKASLTKSVVSKTENVNTTQTLGAAKGNNAKTYSLTAATGPIHGEPRILINGGPGIVNLVTWDAYAKTISVLADKVNAGDALMADYKHKVIAPASQAITIQDGITTYNLTVPVYVTDDTISENPSTPGVDEFGYTYSVSGNFVVMNGAVPLVKDTDYIVDAVAGTISFPAAVTGDVIDVDYTGYTVSATIQQSLVTEYTNQVFTLAHTPVAGSLTILENGVPVSADAIDSITGTSLSVDIAYVDLGATLTCTFTYQITETTQESITFETLYGGSLYNAAEIAVTAVTKDGVEGRLITLTKPVSKKYTAAEAPLTFSSFDYPTFGKLIEGLTAAGLNNVFKGVTDYENAVTSNLPLTVATKFTGGTDGVNPTNNEMFVALSGERDTDGFLVKQGAYQILENYNVDFIYVAGVYADSKVTVSTSNFHYELALLCAVLTYRTKMTHGFIDMKPNTNTTLIGIQNYVAKCLAYNNTHYMKDASNNVIADENGNFMDIGWYTSLVIGPEPICVSDTLGTYYGSPALAYAALNAGLSAQSAPTNKALNGVKGMRYKLSNKQMNDLVANRMVVFKQKGEGTSTATSIPYVVDGCTSGAPGSDYARLSTVKVVTEVVDQIREVADPFIGEPNTVEQRNALAALISKRLSYLKEQGVIQFYDFEISASIRQVLLGECSIALTLVAPQELRKITTVVALKAAA